MNRESMSRQMLEAYPVCLCSSTQGGEFTAYGLIQASQVSDSMLKSNTDI